MADFHKISGHMDKDVYADLMVKYEQGVYEAADLDGIKQAPSAENDVPVSVVIPMNKAIEMGVVSG